MGGITDPAYSSALPIKQQSLAADGDQVGSSGSSTDEVHRHSSVTDHWVIGICGRQPVNPPIGSEL